MVDQEDMALRVNSERWGSDAVSLVASWERKPFPQPPPPLPSSTTLEGRSCLTVWTKIIPLLLTVEIRMVILFIGWDGHKARDTYARRCRTMVGDIVYLRHETEELDTPSKA